MVMRSDGIRLNESGIRMRTGARIRTDGDAVKVVEMRVRIGRESCPV